MLNRAKFYFSLEQRKITGTGSYDFRGAKATGTYGF